MRKLFEEPSYKSQTSPFQPHSNSVLITVLTLFIFFSFPYSNSNLPCCVLCMCMCAHACVRARVSLSVSHPMHCQWHDNLWLMGICLAGVRINHKHLCQERVSNLKFDLGTSHYCHTNMLGLLSKSIRHNKKNWNGKVSLHIPWRFTGYPGGNVPDFGRMFLKLKYTEITQNTYIQSWTVTEIMSREVWNFDSRYTLIDYQIHIKTGRSMLFM